jgi:signal transduction histidine kinase
MQKVLNFGSRRLALAVPTLIGKSWLGRILSRHLSIVSLLLVLVGEAGVAVFVMRDLGRSYATVENMYNGSVQGLLRVGDMQYEAQETRRSTLYALTTTDGNLQVAYADQSRDADRGVTEGIAQYLAHARSAQETRAGQQLAKDWTDYLKVRDEVLGLILEGSPREAVHLDLNLGVSEFDHVRRDLDDAKKSYDAEASQQLATVAELSRASMARLTAALVSGLFLGTIALWAIQRSRMRSAVQLAQLQMDFVASVSHELRTPLTAILTAAENIRDGFALDREGLFEQGSLITDQANQLIAIVEQVLLFSATRQAKSTYFLREVCVNDVIEDALRSTQTLTERAGFSIEIKIEPDLPPVIADLSLLSQCLQNLIVNSVKYGSGKRWIGISARMDQDENMVLMSVQDQGIGIDAADLTRIFEPFYRSPRVVGARIRGTGLGLSIAKRSAETFGGQLTVSSQLGVGSEFTVHLPVATEVRQEASSAESAIGGARV